MPRMDQDTAIKEAFAAFDKGGSGKINVIEFGNCIRAAGANPTEEDVGKMIKSADPSESGYVQFAKFAELAKKKLGVEDDVESICMAYKNFDKDDNGMINCAELRHILTNLGEKMTNEDVDELIREAEIDKDGMINYREFVKMQLSL